MLWHAQALAWPETGPGDNCNGRPGDLAPIPPASEMFHIVCADDQGKGDAGITPPQRAQGLVGVLTAQFGFERGDHHGGPLGPHVGRSKTLAEWARLRLQRILRRYQPPHAVEPKPRPRRIRHMRMALMRRIERAPEQADAHARIGEGKAAAHELTFMDVFALARARRI